MSHWNHRVMKRTLGDGSEYYGIHEVFYNDDGSIYAFTKNSMDVFGESVEDLRQTLEWMLKCLEHPILDYDNTPCTVDDEDLHEDENED